MFGSTLEESRFAFVTAWVEYHTSSHAYFAVRLLPGEEMWAQFASQEQVSSNLRFLHLRPSGLSILQAGAAVCGMPLRAHADSVPTASVVRNAAYRGYAFPESNLGDCLGLKVREGSRKVIVEITHYNPAVDDLGFLVAERGGVYNRPSGMTTLEEGTSELNLRFAAGRVAKAATSTFITDPPRRLTKVDCTVNPSVFTFTLFYRPCFVAPMPYEEDIED